MCMIVTKKLYYGNCTHRARRERACGGRGGWRASEETRIRVKEKGEVRRCDWWRVRGEGMRCGLWRVRGDKRRCGCDWRRVNGWSGKGRCGSD